MAKSKSVPATHWIPGDLQAFHHLQAALPELGTAQSVQGGVVADDLNVVKDHLRIILYNFLQWFNTHRIHGAGIYANIGGILMGSMLPYIAAPWILWDMIQPFRVYL